MNEVQSTWVAANPLGLNETLLAMKAYAPYHHLYAIAMCFAISSNQSSLVASPSRAWEAAKKANMISEVVRIAGQSLNMALKTATNAPQQSNRVFSPQNWIKSKPCLDGINNAIGVYFNMLDMMEGGVDVKKRLNEATILPVEAFEYRWSAD